MSFARSFWTRGRTVTHSLLLFWFSNLVMWVADLLHLSLPISGIWYALGGHTSADLGIQPSTWCKTSSSLKDFCGDLRQAMTSCHSDHFLMHSLIPLAQVIEEFIVQQNILETWSSALRTAVRSKLEWKWWSYYQLYCLWCNMTTSNSLQRAVSLGRGPVTSVWLDLEANVSRKCDMVATFLSVSWRCGHSWFQILLSTIDNCKRLWHLNLL